MNNKLLQMKRKMLQKQQQKDKEAKLSAQQPPSPNKVEPEVASPEKKVDNVVPPPISQAQEDKNASEEKVESVAVQQEAAPEIVVSKPPEVVQNPLEPVAQEPKESNESPVKSPKPAAVDYELEQGEEPPEQGQEGQVQLGNQEPNLQIQERQPNLSCSVDEDPKSQGFHNEEVMVAESKQDRKQRKIVLKELELVKKCVRNLKQSLKGLESIQKKIQVRPQLKEQLQVYLQQLRAIQSEAQVS